MRRWAFACCWEPRQRRSNAARQTNERVCTWQLGRSRHGSDRGHGRAALAPGSAGDRRAADPQRRAPRSRRRAGAAVRRTERAISQSDTDQDQDKAEFPQDARHGCRSLSGDAIQACETKQMRFWSLVKRMCRGKRSAGAVLMTLETAFRRRQYLGVAVPEPSAGPVAA